MTREEMMQDVIKKYGHESEVAIWFCFIAESYTDSSLQDEIVKISYELCMKDYSTITIEDDMEYIVAVSA